MSRDWPYVQYMKCIAGPSTKFIVGETQRKFEIHNSALLKHSSLFINADGTTATEVPPDFPRTIQLRQICEVDFVFICRWLYDASNWPPTNTLADLSRLMRLWCAGGELGLWKYQNAMLRLAMSVCQPRNFEIPIVQVKLVYAKTPADSKLRRFIITAWVQRSSNVKAEVFSAEYRGMGILEDAIKALEMLKKVRNRMAYPITQDENGNVKVPLPSYLVWNERGNDLPDDMFMNPVDSKETAVGLMNQARSPGATRNVLVTSDGSAW